VIVRVVRVDVVVAVCKQTLQLLLLLLIQMQHMNISQALDYLGKNKHLASFFRRVLDILILVFYIVG
jgi:hypothetical protein